VCDIRNTEGTKKELIKTVMMKAVMVKQEKGREITNEGRNRGRINREGRKEHKKSQERRKREQWKMKKLINKELRNNEGLGKK
jgi:coenzyme F420-reducing hydrogenase beta subunit